MAGARPAGDSTEDRRTLLRAAPAGARQNHDPSVPSLKSGYYVGEQSTFLARRTDAAS
jgi:hypothetical protein